MSEHKSLEQRVAAILETYDQQGIHRTGTIGDTENAHYLAEQIKAVGQKPLLTKFRHLRVDPILSELQIGNQTIQGIPFFDGTFTDKNGVRGQMGAPEDNAPIAVGHHQTNRGWDKPQLAHARQRSNVKAMIAICKRTHPDDVRGLTPTNAENFTTPFGPPVLQVPDSAEERIAEAISGKKEARLIAQVARTEVQAMNVETRIQGKNSSLPPLVVITPRSGWWQCVSERGGGIACWLEMIRALSEHQPQRDVWFVASTGHELGHLGLKFFLSHHRPLIKAAHVWIHLGANFAAANCPIRLQAPREEMAQLAHRAIAGTSISEIDFTPVGTRPGGEAQNIYDSGGQYISIVGRNRLFHHPADRWPSAIDLQKIVHLIHALTKLTVQLANSEDLM
jgi:hypothetical protein